MYRHRNKTETDITSETMKKAQEVVIFLTAIPDEILRLQVI